MERQGQRRSCLVVSSTAATLLISLGCISLAWGHTPESPKVQEMVKKACAFLETENDARLGGKALIALVLVKENYPSTHPRIQEAVNACKQAAKMAPRAMFEEHGIYSIGIALIFLCEAGPEAYRPEIDKLIETLVEIQRPEGGWGYPPGHGHDDTGDTSMTQYAVLGMWTAHSKGIRIPSEPVRKVGMWLTRTQDPSGAWGYQGREPNGAGRVAQRDIRHSMVAAGLGSTYVCADLMGIANSVSDVAAAIEEPEFPAAFKPVGEERGAAQVVSAAGASGAIGRAIADGNGWFDKNYRIDPDEYPIYYMYGLERYRSFQELLTKKSELEPKWYNDGVEYLAKNQEQSGRWMLDGLSPTGAVDTAFATLFLIRSTKKSIQAAVNYGDGRLAGGRGLPKDLTNARIKKGKIVAETLAASAEDVLALLEDPENPEFDKLADNPESVLLQANLGNAQGELERLRRVVRGGSPEARRLAVKALGQKRDLNNVSVLIYALSDPDAIVVQGARDSLRFISRKFDGFGLPDNPTPDEKQQAVFHWKAWYKSIKPDAEFLD